MSERRTTRSYRIVVGSLWFIAILAGLLYALQLTRYHTALDLISEMGASYQSTTEAPSYTTIVDSTEDRYFIFGDRSVKDSFDRAWDLHLSRPEHNGLLYSALVQADEIDEDLAERVIRQDPDNGLIYLLRAASLIKQSTEKNPAWMKGSDKPRLLISDEDLALEAIENLEVGLSKQLIDDYSRELLAERLSKLPMATDWSLRVPAIVVAAEHLPSKLKLRSVPSFLIAAEKQRDNLTLRSKASKLISKPEIYLKQSSEDLVSGLVSISQLQDLVRSSDVNRKLFPEGGIDEAERRFKLYRRWKDGEKLIDRQKELGRMEALAALSVPVVLKQAPLSAEEMSNLRTEAIVGRRLEDLFALRIMLPASALNILLLGNVLFLWNLRRPKSITIRAKQELLDLPLKVWVMQIGVSIMIPLTAVFLVLWTEPSAREVIKTIQYKAVLLFAFTIVTGTSLLTVPQLILPSIETESKNLRATIALASAWTTFLTIAFYPNINSRFAVFLVLGALLFISVTTVFVKRSATTESLVRRQVIRHIAFLSSITTIALYFIVMLVAFPPIEQKLAERDQFMKVYTAPIGINRVEHLVTKSLHNELLYIAQPLFPDEIPADIQSRIPQK